jgi:5-oxoprolinase (ATP-hydrolysing) subunit A
VAAIDLNADLGETVRGVPTADDAAMFAVVSSASIACGGHAGDAASMRAAVALAAEHGVATGAHPSYVDAEDFGRSPQNPVDLRGDIARQLRALQDAGADIRYVKPHGALYHAIVHDRGQAEAVAAAVADLAARLGRALPVLGMRGEISRAAEAVGLGFVEEAFLDRAYRPDGSLVPRGEAGAVHDDAGAAAVRALRLVREGIVEAVDGTAVAVRAASLCLHGDSPAAVAMGRAVRAALDEAGVEVRAPW